MNNLEKTSKTYKENLESIKSNRWLDKKHLKHSRVVVAAFESIVERSTTGYNCMVCREPGAINQIQNKRKTGRKGWDDVNVRYCRSCSTEVEKFFPATYEYCK